MSDVEHYQKLVTDEHRDKPRFIGGVTALVQPSVDQQAEQGQFPTLYDLDTAIGQQLDVCGQWIGRDRYVRTPLTDVYFSFDVVGLGFDEGVWQGPFDPSTGLEVLPDDFYRTLLRAIIANNHWDGSIPHAYEIWETLFQGDPELFIFDHQDMSMSLGFGGGPFDAVTYELMTGGYLDLRPAGVLLRNYLFQSVPGAPFFGFDADTAAIAGFDEGAWAIIVEPT